MLAPGSVAGRTRVYYDCNACLLEGRVLVRDRHPEEPMEFWLEAVILRALIADHAIHSFACEVEDEVDLNFFISSQHDPARC